MQLSDTASSRAGGAGRRQRRAVVVAWGSALRYFETQAEQSTGHNRHQTLSCPSGWDVCGRWDAAARATCMHLCLCVFALRGSRRYQKKGYVFPPPASCACGRIRVVAARLSVMLRNRRLNKEKPWALHLRQPVCDVAEALRTCRHGALSSTACGLTVVMPTMGRPSM